MISIKGLKKTYLSGATAVNGVDLEIGAGEILALLGPNGAGKTTTIKVATTLSGFDEGEVLVASHNVDSAPELVRQAIGYVAQETGIDYFLTGRENMRLQGQLYHMTKSDIRQRIDELSQYFKINDALDNLVSTYSGGNRRKLDIACALIHRPKVLFLDEPTLGLDTQSRQDLWRYIRRINEDLGLTILLTTHYLEEADKLAHKVAIINQGQIKIIDTPLALKQSIQGDVVSISFVNESTENQTFFWNLKTQDYVKDASWEGNNLHIYVTNGPQAIPKIMEAAHEALIEIGQISFSQPSLDDVFIRYTGASLNSKSEDGGEQWWEKWAGKAGPNNKWAKKWQQENNTDENWQQKQKTPSQAPVEQWQNNNDASSNTEFTGKEKTQSTNSIETEKKTAAPVKSTSEQNENWQDQAEKWQNSPGEWANQWKENKDDLSQAWKTAPQEGKSSDDETQKGSVGTADPTDAASKQAWDKNASQWQKKSDD
ncbi:MAG: ATP-binding cassette domain-containing protein [Gammaproteobacteria bacterium]|nr:ATP-binding cassette domain-containing protein [Gammaproteobacteria bacterium]MDH5728693.1 ATP-binding cassette domain-containing protein [Gammaproteobacteria bacterium]